MEIALLILVGAFSAYLVMGALVCAIVHLVMYVEPVGPIRRTIAVIFIILIWPVVLLGY